MNTYDISTTRGDTYEGVSFVITEKLTPSDPTTPIDLTGCEIKMQVRRDYDSTEPLIEWSSTATPPSILIEGADNNIVNILAKDIPSSVPARRCVYDVQIKFPNNEIKTWIKGFFEILKDVTR